MSNRTDDNVDENGVDLTLIDYMLSLTPMQRLETLEHALHFEERLAAARVKLVGFDPRAELKARFGLEYTQSVTCMPHQ
jgi:hypothetical protein